MHTHTGAEPGQNGFEGGVNAGIRHYLSSTMTENESQAINRFFDNEELDPLIVWKNIQVVQNKVATAEIHNNEECFIEIDYRLKKDVVGFRLWLTVYDERNIIIFKSFFDEERLWGSNFSQGQYKSTAIIPANIFIEGRYIIGIHGTVHDERMLNPKDGIHFEIDVYETGKVYRKHWDESFRGLITLPLIWKTEQTGN